MKFKPANKETVQKEPTPEEKFPFIFFEDAEVYHTKSKKGEVLSSHMLADFRKSPLLYHKKITGEIPDKDSSAYLVGRATHSLILEGEEVFDTEYLVTDGPTNEKTGKAYGKDTKAYKAWLEEQDPAKQIISTQDFALIETMNESVQNHPEAVKLLDDGVAEAVIRTEIDGHPCQIRMDWLHPKKGLVDLKTCDDLDWFTYDAKKYGYIHQLAFYRSVIEAAADRVCPVWIIAVEKKEPFRTGVFKIIPGSLDDAAHENRAAIGELKKCFATGIWPTGFEEVRPMY